MLTVTAVMARGIIRKPVRFVSEPENNDAPLNGYKMICNPRGEPAEQELL